jgi:hypothetical protein
MSTNKSGESRDWGNLVVNPPEKKPASVQVVEKIINDLENNVVNIRREDAIRSVQDIFIMKRLNAASTIEDARARAIESLTSKLATMSPGLLLKTIETLSQVGEVDIGAITGSPNTKGGVNLYNVINNRNSNANLGASLAGSIASSDSSGKADSSTVKDIGGLLEAITGIAESVKHNPRIIDGAAGTLEAKKDPEKTT